MKGKDTIQHALAGRVASQSILCLSSTEPYSYELECSGDCVRLKLARLPCGTNVSDKCSLTCGYCIYNYHILTTSPKDCAWLPHTYITHLRIHGRVHGDGGQPHVYYGSTTDYCSEPLQPLGITGTFSLYPSN